MGIKKDFVTAILLLLLSLTLYAQDIDYFIDADNDGRLDIYSKDHLLFLSQDPSADWSADYELMTNIVFDNSDFQIGGDFYNSGAGFSPIGNGSPGFTGSFDGNGFEISGLIINRGSTSGIGFIGFSESAEIKNIRLINVNITGGGYVGGLVGQSNNSTVTNCYVTGLVTGNLDNIGGLAGYSDQLSIITNCYFSGSVTGNSNSYYVGGLVGYIFASTVSKSYSTGSVFGDEYIGGLVGRSSSATIENCYSTSYVEGQRHVGGLLGNSLSSTVNKSYSAGLVYGYFIDQTGGLVGTNNSEVHRSFWDMQASGQSTSAGGTAKTTTQMKMVETFLDAFWDGSIWNMGDGINDGYPYLDWQNPDGTPLPVELTLFEGTATEEGVLLEWETATEVNNYGFEIQKSENSSQESEESWESIGFVQGNGTTNSPKNYEFTDSELPNSDVVSYRLKQIDNDGTFAYSKVVTVDLTDITSVDDEIIYEFALEQNYPNPFNPTTAIKFTVPNKVRSGASPNNTKLIVYDILGREVATLLNRELKPGNHEVNFDATSLSSGIYFYRIDVSNEYQSVKKMLLVK